MPTTQKSLPGQLVDITTEQLKGDVMVYISPVTSLKSDEIPEIKAILSINGWKPELHDRRYKLKLDKLSDDVILSMQPVNMANFDITQTWFTIFFVGNTWNSPEWVEYIHDLFKNPS